MLKERSSFIGVGQCGNNLASIMEKKYDYNCLMINTSKEDIEAVNPKHMFHLEGGKGLAKNPAMIEEVLTKHNNKKNLVEALKKHTEKTDIVFVEFSSGGGTGNALGYIICGILVKMGKTVCSVVVIPNEEDESVNVSKNTWDCIKNVSELKGTGATFILDNKRAKDKFQINNEFADVLNCYLTRENISNKGNMDESEFEKLLKTSGVAILTKVSRDRSNSSNLLDTIRNNIYAPMEDIDAQLFGISIAEKCSKAITRKDIVNEIGFVMDDYIGYGGNNTLLFLAGMSFPMKRIRNFKEVIQDNKDNILKMKKKKSVSAFDEEDDDDFDDLFDMSEKDEELDSLFDINEEKPHKKNMFESFMEF